MLDRYGNKTWRRSLFLSLAFCLFIFLSFTLALGTLSDRRATTSLLIISDVHFNPFYDPAIFFDLVNSSVDRWPAIFKSSSVTGFPSWGSETNYPLLVRALDSARKEAGSGSLLIFPGDILAHKFRDSFFELYGQQDEEALRSFVHKTVLFFAKQVRERFGRVPAIFALGNNDSYAGDYSIEPGGRFLADTAQPFHDLFLLGAADRRDFLQTYRAGGYYVARPHGSKIVIISLNTVLFSGHWGANSVSITDDPAGRELDWLEKTLALARARGWKVWILMHIPPGADIYSTVTTYMDETGHISDATPFWKAEYQDRFLRIISRYAEVIQASFAGHTHMEEYRLLLKNKATAHEPLIIAPSISPVFDNDPAFKIVTMDSRSWELLDYQTVACHLGTLPGRFKTLYRFSDTYCLKMPLNPGLTILFPLLGKDQVLESAYARFYYSGHNAADSIKATTWPAYWCGIGRMEDDDYIDCVNAKRH